MTHAAFGWLSGLLSVMILFSLWFLWVTLLVALLNWGTRWSWPVPLEVGRYSIWETEHGVLEVPVYDVDHDARAEFYCTWGFILVTLAWIIIIHWS